MTSISNLIEPIVASYFMTNAYNSHNPDEEKIKGGFPINKLIDIEEPRLMKGGSIGNTDTIKMQFKNLGVPIGLVYIEENYPCEDIEYENYQLNEEIAEPIDDKMYDTLVELASYPVPTSIAHNKKKTSPKRKTSPKKNSTSKKTLKIIK